MMNAKEITTLSQFAEFINASDDWTSEMDGIIERNGWQDADNNYDYCYSDTEVLTQDDNGHAYVAPRN